MEPKGQTVESQAANTNQSNFGATIGDNHNANQCKASSVTSFGRYLRTGGLHVEGRTPRPSSTGSPTLATDNSHLSTLPWVFDSVFQNVVEVRTNRSSSEQEEPNLHRPPCMTKNNTMPVTTDRQSFPGASMSDTDLCRPFFMINNGDLPTTTCPPVFDNTALKETASGVLIASLKKRDAHRALAMANLRLQNLKHEILQGQALLLQGPECKSSTEDMKPLRAPQNKKEHVTMNPQRDPLAPDLSASAVTISTDCPGVGLQATRTNTSLPRSNLDSPALTIKRILNTYSGQIIEGRTTGNLVARKCSSAKEMKLSKGKVASKTGKTAQSDSHKSTAEGMNHATSNTKGKHKTKSCPFMDNYDEFKARYHSTGKEVKQGGTASMHNPSNTQLLREQGCQLLNSLLTKKTVSPKRVLGTVATNTTKAGASAGDTPLGKSSSKLTKRVRFDLSSQRAGDPTTREAAKQLKWCEAASPISNVHKTTHLQKARRGTLSSQDAKATLVVEDLNQDGTTLLNNNMQETKSPQLAEATTSGDIQAAGTNSAEATKLDEATESNKIMDQTVSPTKVAGQLTGLLSGRAKLARPLIVTKNVYLTINPQGQTTEILTDKDNLKAKDTKLHKDDSTTKTVHQTLRLGRVILLPARVNPADLKEQKAVIDRNNICDLGIIGTNLSLTLPQVEKLQEFTKHGHNRGKCSPPHSSQCALAIASGEPAAFM